MIHTPERNPLGHIIYAYQVLGKETDGQERWVGADVLLEVHAVGRFFLNVVTKSHFADEHLRHNIDGAQQPESLLQDAPIDTRQPYLVNDEELTEEVLTREFAGQTVEPGMASSMWYTEPNQIAS